MDDNKFNEQLRKVCSLIFNYGLRNLRLNETESLMETYKRVESWTIIRKDFEGFKMAQKEIVKAILEIEDQIIPLRKLKEEITRGKKRMEVSRDPNYVKHSISEERLILQKAAFQDVANSIVWILFGATRGHVRRLINPESRHGYLRDRNLDTEIAVVEMINESSDSFALLADITSVVGIGDIIELSPRGLKIMEIKAGKVAEIFFESVSEQELSMKVENFVQDDPRRMRALEKQMGRQARQIIRMKRAIGIIKKDHGIDPITGKEIHIIELDVEGECLNNAVSRVLEEPSDDVYNNSFPLIIVADCHIIGITALKEASAIVRRMNFQHLLYHIEKIPLERCHYLCEGGSEADPRDPKDIEPMAYFDIMVHDLKYSVLIPTHTPLFLMVGEIGALKLLADEISVFVRFYPEKFIETCKRLGYEASWIDESKLARYLEGSGMKRINVAEFDGRYIEICSESGRAILTTSAFYSMIYELETGRSIANKLMGMLKRQHEEAV